MVYALTVAILGISVHVLSHIMNKC